MAGARATRYSLGRIHAASDVLSFSRDPLACLERTRAFRGSVIWTSAVPEKMVLSEEAADQIIRGLREKFPAAYVEDGIRPLSAVHGVAWYERYVVLNLTEEEKPAVRAFVASLIGRTAEEVRAALEEISEDQLARL